MERRRGRLTVLAVLLGSQLILLGSVGLMPGSLPARRRGQLVEDNRCAR
ncbi:MAG: hypothetical protein KKA73_09135 [Chloroflexi bacterium]|nr:hypothetical protein [Chloroflexota bacterium]